MVIFAYHNAFKSVWSLLEGYPARRRRSSERSPQTASASPPRSAPHARCHFRTHLPAPSPHRLPRPPHPPRRHRRAPAPRRRRAPPRPPPRPPQPLPHRLRVGLRRLRARAACPRPRRRPPPRRLGTHDLPAPQEHPDRRPRPRVAPPGRPSRLPSRHRPLRRHRRRPLPLPPPRRHPALPEGPPVMTPAAARASLRRAVPAPLPVLLVGAPGVGKTAIVKQLAEELDLPLVVSHPVTSDPTDFRGLPWMVDGRATFLPIGDLARLADLDGRPAIWLIDDLGQVLNATQAAVMQLVHRDSRALHGFRPPNPAQDPPAVGIFPPPLVPRFTTVLTVEPEPASFVQWAIRRGGFHPLVASFIRWQPDHLLDQTRPEHSLEPRCSTRTWGDVSRLLDLGLAPPRSVPPSRPVPSPSPRAPR